MAVSAVVGLTLAWTGEVELTWVAGAASASAQVIRSGVRCERAWLAVVERWVWLVSVSRRMT